jgi:hypothetical protein
MSLAAVWPITGAGASSRSTQAKTRVTRRDKEELSLASCIEANREATTPDPGAYERALEGPRHGSLFVAAVLQWGSLGVALRRKRPKRSSRISRRRAATEGDTDVAALLDQVGRDRARLIELGNMLAEGELSRAEYGRLTARVEERITDAESRLARTQTVIPADLECQGARLAAAWAAMTLDEKRTLIDAVAECFLVEPAPRPHNAFRRRLRCVETSGHIRVDRAGQDRINAHAPSGQESTQRARQGQRGLSKGECEYALEA